MEVDASGEDLEWEEFIERNRHRDRSLESRVHQIEPDVENEGDDYILKDSDMLWEIGCTVRHFRI
jgi:hypothetical protein